MDLADLLGQPALRATRWSVGIRGGGPDLHHDAGRLLRTASVGKVFLLIEVADRLERGLLDPSQSVRRDQVIAVADSGLWQHLSTAELPVVDAACLVGAVSDNWATNALLDLVGLESVRARARRLAPGGSMLHDLVRDVRAPHHPATLSQGCAADWVELFAGLAEGRVVSRAVSDQVLAWLATSTDLSMVASALLLDPLAHGAPGHESERGVRLWNKTGTTGRARADVGLVRGPAGPVSYAALCTWERAEDRPLAAVLAAMRDLGEEVARRAGAR